MSELSEQVSNLISSSIREARPVSQDHAGIEIAAEDTGFEKYDGFLARRAYGTWQVSRAIRRVVRLHGGQEWSTVQEAMDAVRNDLLSELIPVALMTLADGVLMGRKPIPVIKKYRTLGALEELFVTPTFRQEAELMAFTLSGDWDLVQGLRKYLTSSTYATGATCGATSDESSQVRPDQIFDIWMVSMVSIVIMLYVVGVQVGQAQEEAETLAGIMAASTTEQENPA